MQLAKNIGNVCQASRFQAYQRYSSEDLVAIVKKLTREINAIDCSLPYTRARAPLYTKVEDLTREVDLIMFVLVERDRVADEAEQAQLDVMELFHAEREDGLIIDIEPVDFVDSDIKPANN